MKTKTSTFHSIKIPLLMIGVMLMLRTANAQCEPLPAGIVAWWPGDGNANDIIGANNGVLQGGLTFTQGEVGQAFSFNGSNSFVEISPSPSYFPSTNSFSWASWFQTTNPTANAQIILAIYEAAWSYPRNGQNYGESDIEFGTENGVPYGFVRDHDQGGSGANGGQQIDGHTFIADGRFHHLVLERNMELGMLMLFLDGNLEIQQPLSDGASGGIIDESQMTIPFFLGAEPSFESGVVENYFQGAIDEVSIFNRALSSNEVSAIYAAGSAGMCTTPSIISQPQSQVGYWGQSVTFSVTATTNFPPMSYQWQSNSVAISGATSQTLTLTNLQASFAAGYTVIVSNPYGSVTSAPPAILTINPAGVGIALYPGISIAGVAGYTYGIQYSTNLANPNGWIGLTNLNFTQPLELWYDSVPAIIQQRFYRVLQGPISIP